jgi:hypothetical protein
MSGYERYYPAGEGWPDPEAQVISKPFSRAALLAMVTQMLAVNMGAGPRRAARAAEVGRGSVREAGALRDRG